MTVLLDLLLVLCAIWTVVLLWFGAAWVASTRPCPPDCPECHTAEVIDLDEYRAAR